VTLVRVQERFIAACGPFLRSADASDRVHAATCLQEGAVLVSNDRDFDPLRKAGLIEVRRVSEALRRWPPPEGR
jgi:predicted nucleic acid-binding protein